MNFWIGIIALVVFVALMTIISFSDYLSNNFYIECLLRGGIPGRSGGGDTCMPIFDT